MAKRDGDDPSTGRMSRPASVLWALVPLYTFGLGTMFVLGWAAYRLRSVRLAVSAAIASIITVYVFTGVGTAAAGALVVLGLMGGGLVGTFAVRDLLVQPELPGTGFTAGGWMAPPAAALPDWTGRRGLVDPAVHEALAHRQRRNEARRLLTADAALGRELCIGRPDLAGRFDDGGLVDVNHVPAAVLAALPGMTPELAARIVQAREERGGFTLPQELEAFAELPPGLVDDLADRLLFLR